MEPIKWTIDSAGLLSTEYFPIHDAVIDEVFVTKKSITISAIRKDLGEICFLSAEGVAQFRLAHSRKDIVYRVFVKSTEDYKLSGIADEILKSVYENSYYQDILMSLQRDCISGRNYFEVLITCNMGSEFSFIAETINISVQKLS